MHNSIFFFAVRTEAPLDSRTVYCVFLPYIDAKKPQKLQHFLRICRKLRETRNFWTKRSPALVAARGTTHQFPVQFTDGPIWPASCTTPSRGARPGTRPSLCLAIAPETTPLQSPPLIRHLLSRGWQSA
jgi:hypothetical protein